MILGHSSTKFNMIMIASSHTNLRTGNKDCSEVRLEITFDTVRINEQLNTETKFFCPLFLSKN